MLGDAKGGELGVRPPLGSSSTLDFVLSAELKILSELEIGVHPAGVHGVNNLGPAIGVLKFAPPNMVLT